MRRKQERRIEKRKIGIETRVKCFYLKKNYLRVAGDLDLSYLHKGWIRIVPS